MRHIIVYIYSNLNVFRTKRSEYKLFHLRFKIDLSKMLDDGVIYTCMILYAFVAIIAMIIMQNIQTSRAREWERGGGTERERDRSAEVAGAFMLSVALNSEYFTWALFRRNVSNACICNVICYIYSNLFEFNINSNHVYMPMWNHCAVDHYSNIKFGWKISMNKYKHGIDRNS